MSAYEEIDEEDVPLPPIDLFKEREKRKQKEFWSDSCWHDAKCQHEYLPDADGTVYTCGGTDDLQFVDGIALCEHHRKDH